MAVEHTIYPEYVDRIFPKLQNIIDKENGKRKKPITYLYQEYLKNTYSPDGSWEAGSVNSTRVAADIIALDSPLPIKSRPTVEYANGKLPKIGMALTMKESELKAVDLMIARGDKWAKIAAKIAADAVACENGVKEINEYNFLYALNHGYVVIPDTERATLGHRFNFKYLARNHVGVADTSVGYTLDDLQKAIDTASDDGNTITQVWLSLKRYNALRATDGAKQMWADYNKIPVTNYSKVGVPTKSAFNEAAKDRYGVDFVVIDHLTYFERNGVKIKKRPWDDNRIVYLTEDMAGSFVYSETTESKHKVDGVKYTEVDNYMLISKFAQTNPLREMTGVQAEALPVIEDVDKLYLTDITVAYTDRATEGSEHWEDMLAI